MPKRPKTLIHANSEQPPPAVTAVLGLQHAALALVLLIYPVLIGKGAGLPLEQQHTLVTATLLACGVGALLQAGHWRFGSALLVIPIAQPIFVPIAIQAGLSGGLAAIAGLTLMIGLLQFLIGRFIRKVSAFFPPEVCGVVVLMLGVSLIPGAVRRMIGTSVDMGDATAAFVPEAILVGGVTLAAIVLASVWLKGSARFFAMAIGCLAGLLAATQADYLNALGNTITQAPVLALPPLGWPSFEFLPALLPVIVLLVLVESVDSMGVLISTERLDDAEWIRPNMPQVAQGIQANGLSNITASLLGGTALGLSSSNIGLAFATGVTSRIVGMATGGILIAAAFFPKLIALVLAMPDPVLGGILVYVASYFVVVGADLALSRMMSQRRMLVIGLSITAGLSVLALPELFLGLTGSWALIFQSPLAVSALCAIVLNGLMRVGIAQTFVVTLPVGAPHSDMARETLNELGEQWGLHRQTVSQASMAVHELLDVVVGLANGAIDLEARTNDQHFDVRLLYDGMPMIFPDQAPSAEDMLDNPQAVALMSGWLLRHLSERAVPFERAGRQGVWLRFNG